MEVRDDIDQLGIEQTDFFFELVDDHPVVVHLYRRIASLIEIEGLQRAEIGRQFGDDKIAGLDKNTADQVKTILKQSTRKFDGLKVSKPGSSEEVPFSQLSVTGGLVNAYEAAKLAETIKSQPKQK